MAMARPEVGVSVSREHARSGCALPACVLPVGEGEGLVVVSPSRARGDGSVAGMVIDLSMGGVSVVTEVFLPRGCEVEVVVSGDGGVVHRLGGQIRNVAMVDRGPRYKLGIRLVGEESERRVMVEALLGSAAASGGA